MKIKLVLILSILVNGAFSQDSPKDEEVLIAIEKIKRLHVEENDIDKQASLSENSSLRFVHNQFTSQNGSECLAIVPMEVGRHYSEWIVLFKKNNMGFWSYGNWFCKNQNSVDIIDVNADGIFEIIKEYSGLGQGYLTGGYELLSIENEIETILYSNKTYDNSGGAYVMNSEKGDTISITVEVNFVDDDNDEILEIQENVAIGTFEWFDSNTWEVRQSFVQKKNLFNYINGQYEMVE